MPECLCEISLLNFKNIILRSCNFALFSLNSTSCIVKIGGESGLLTRGIAFPVQYLPVPELSLLAVNSPNMRNYVKTVLLLW